MILIALGANLPHSEYGAPQATIAAALDVLASREIRPDRVSRRYSTAPVPPSGQPRYVNVVASVVTAHAPDALMRELHAVEEHFGRARAEPNAARVLDIDLIDYRGVVQDDWPLLPHPRMAGRAFVLVPLADVAPDWRDPRSGAHVRDLIARAPDLAGVELLDARDAVR